MAVTALGTPSLLDTWHFSRWLMAWRVTLDVSRGRGVRVDFLVQVPTVAAAPEAFMDRTTSERQPALAQLTWSTGALLSAFFLSFGACSQDLSGVAYKFLQRHGVPCPSVLKVGASNDFAEVAT